MGRIDQVAVLTSFARAAAISTLALKGSRYIPKPLKWIVLFLLALNGRSFPLLWHCKFQSFIFVKLSSVQRSIWTCGGGSSPEACVRTMHLLTPFPSLSTIVFLVKVLPSWIAGIFKQLLIKRYRGKKAHLTRLHRIAPVGERPLDVVEIWKGRAGKWSYDPSALCFGVWKPLFPFIRD